MAIDIPEIQKIQRAWTTKKSYIIAASCFIAGVLIFTITYLGIDSMTAMNQQILSFMVSRRQPDTTNFMNITSFIASAPTLIMATAIIAGFWASYKREAWRPLLLGVAMVLATIMSSLLKSWLTISRPLKADMVPPFELGFSFPSGHAISIAVLLLVMGYLIYSRHSSLQRIICWVCGTVIVTGIVAFSRLYLGQHWLTDIIGSIGLGLVILAFIIFIDKLTTNRFPRLQ